MADPDQVRTRRDGSTPACRRERLGISEADTAAAVKLSAPERKAVLSALAERDPDAEVCAWVDASKTKVGYEIPLNRHFYVYEPPRPLKEIEADLEALEKDIAGLLSDVVRS